MLKILSVLSAACMALVLGAASPASAAERSAGAAINQETAQAGTEVSSQRRYRRSAGWRRGYHGGRRGYYRPYYGYRTYYRPRYYGYSPYYRPYPYYGYGGYGYGGGYGFYRPRPFIGFGYGGW